MWVQVPPGPFLYIRSSMDENEERELNRLAFEEMRVEINQTKGPDDPKIPPLNNRNWKPALINTTKLGVPLKGEGLAVIVSDEKAYFYKESRDNSPVIIIGTNISSITFK